MSQQASVIRQEHLLKLESFCRSLREGLGRAGLTAEKSIEVMRSAVAGECVQCGIHLSGEELVLLSQPPLKTEESAKIQRLRLGDCARKGCDSFYYRMIFGRHMELDWTTFLNGLEQPEAKPAVVATEAAREISKPRRSPILKYRFLIGVAIVLFIFIARQWYLGGRIPFIREPEKFRVDPGQEESSVTENGG